MQWSRIVLLSCVCQLISALENTTTDVENTTTTQKNSDYDIIKDSWRYLYIISGFLSVIALTLTLINYAFTPGMKTLNGYCLKFHAFFLMNAFLIESIQEVLRNFFPSIYYWDNCFFVEYLFVFCFLSSFLWLQVLSYDIWRTFRQTNIATREVLKKSLLRYSIFVYTIPGVIVVISSYFRIKEGNAVKNCWIDNEIYTFTITVPATLIVVTNLFFCVSTALLIRRLKKETQATLHTSETRSNAADKLQFKLYVKLFSVMGGTWVIWVTVQLLEVHAHIEQAFNFHVYGFFDCIYNLQGVMVYITTVLATPNRAVLLHRFKESKYFKTTQPSSSGGTASSTNL